MPYFVTVVLYYCFTNKTLGKSQEFEEFGLLSGGHVTEHLPYDVAPVAASRKIQSNSCAWVSTYPTGPYVRRQQTMMLMHLIANPKMNVVGASIDCGHRNTATEMDFQGVNCSPERTI
ncbi:hypothetical protein HBI56_175750 [Parastagonospora nodorum]|nr:hypothetical protein HBH56_121210 [Parastagonospora nodorum]KAH3924288.1 hypothetical protein HBH54_197110 [Parastagonospora nodorum]KAH3961607.1 hypothetical protein HBH51_181600 [Parastagonospora nodorum]KAH4024703.1 hypothetical protein HBI09_157330 [Parastagonospora nodorum]KAH4060175.1 hypothetical protein HBH50_223170 [Parastagonospora nodorum]